MMLIRDIDIFLTEEAIDFLVNKSGDVRQMLNLFEMAILSKGMVEKVSLDIQDFIEILQKTETKYSLI